MVSSNLFLKMRFIVALFVCLGCLAGGQGQRLQDRSLQDRSLQDQEREEVATILEYFSDLLKINHDDLSNKIGDDKYDGCSYYTACETNNTWPGAFFPIQDLEEHNNIVNLSVNVDVPVVKIVANASYSADTESEICIADSQTNIWKNNLLNAAHLLPWQYWGSSGDGDNNAAFVTFYPGFSWSEIGDCGEDTYDHRLRPWYVSGESAQKDVIVVVDVSNRYEDLASFELVKQSAITLLRSLSHRDFVGVAKYSVFAHAYQTSMIRATAYNILALVEYVESLVMEDRNADVTIGLQLAYTILSDSLESGDTSLCHNTMVVFSSGANDIISGTRPIDVVKGSRHQAIVFSNLFGAETSRGGALDLAEISCFTRGNFLATLDPNLVVMRYNKYFASSTVNEEIRYSEFYDDALGQGRLSTGSLPVYDENTDGHRTLVGVVSIDVPIEVLLVSDDVTEADLQEFLVEHQSCPPMDNNDGFLDNFQTEETCSHTREYEEGESTVERLEGLYAFVSVMVAIFLIMMPCLAHYKIFIDDKRFIEDETVPVMTCVNLVLCLWALCVFWIHMFPDLVRMTTWESTEFIAEQLNENPFRCCDIVNCACQNYDGESCNSRLKSLTEGYCDKGYYCCEEECHRCRCDSDGSCSRCCTCIEQVSHRRCESVCGTCYDAEVVMRYYDKEGSTYFASITEQCGRDDYKCVDDFFTENGPAGARFSGYYNPHNKNEIRRDIGYGFGASIAFYIPVAILVIEFGTFLIAAIWYMCESMCESCTWKVPNMPRYFCFFAQVLFDRGVIDFFLDAGILTHVILRMSGWIRKKTKPRPRPKKKPIPAEDAIRVEVPPTMTISDGDVQMYQLPRE